MENYFDKTNNSVRMKGRIRIRKIAGTQPIPSRLFRVIVWAAVLLMAGMIMFFYSIA